MPVELFWFFPGTLAKLAQAFRMLWAVFDESFGDRGIKLMFEKSTVHNKITEFLIVALSSAA